MKDGDFLAHPSDKKLVDRFKIISICLIELIDLKILMNIS
jgi:hypothetical protein